MKCLIKVLAVLFTLGLFLCESADAQRTITLTWDAPVENTDGSPYVDPGGFKVYRKDAGPVWTEVADIPHAQTTTDRTDVGAGTYCYVVTAYNVKGMESERSNEACVSVTKPQTFELRITIN